MFSDVIIMAGGFGERLWPASSASFPKQFMKVSGGNSFLQESINRALLLDITGKIIIVTRKDIEKKCIEQVNELAESVKSDELRKKIIEDTIVLAEPVPKHTSAAIMSSVVLLKKLFPGEKRLCLVLTSDHIITPAEKFAEDCAYAGKSAADGNFVCYAIPPLEAATGYGYIKTGIDLYGNGKDCNHVFKIENFKEKPDYETAVKYLESGSYWWNSGMFAFDADMFLSEMQKHTPEIYDSFEILLNGKKPLLKKEDGISSLEKWENFQKTYETVPAVAVDKAVAEKTKRAVAVKASFDWTDVGSWDTFSQVCVITEAENIKQVGCSNNFVYSDVPVVLCGVKNLIVVAKNGKLLVMEKGNSEKIRDAVKSMP